ncbi:MAG: thioesterase family protein [Planctomycetota bacterium]
MSASPEGGTHRLRVRYAETDRMGVAHHGSYVDWMEEARTEWLRQGGKTYRQWEDEGVLLQVVEVHLRYMKTTTYDDEVEIRTSVAARGRASITLEYEMRLVGDDELVAVGRTKLACVDGAGRLQRLPAL